MFAKIIQGLSPRVSTPTRLQQCSTTVSPSISDFLQGEKLSFKRISSQRHQNELQQGIRSEKLLRKPLEQAAQPAGEYQLLAATTPVLEASKLPSFQMSFAKQLSVGEPALLANKESMKTASTIEDPRPSHPQPSLHPARTSQNDSLWSSSDRVNISMSDSLAELNMSPYFS